MFAVKLHDNNTVTKMSIDLKTRNVVLVSFQIQETRNTDKVTVATNYSC